MRTLLNRPVTWLVAAWLLVFAALLWRTVPVSGDGIYYYAWLRSAVVDHDVDFRNDLEHFRSNPHVAAQLDSGVATPTGRTPNLFSVGPALLWAPLWLPVHWLSGADGFSRAELLAPNIATGLYGLAGLLLTYGFVRRELDERRVTQAATWAAVAAGSVLLGTNLAYYLAIEASLSHGLGFTVVALLLYLWQRWRSDLLNARGPWWRWLVLGLAVGLAVCIRWQLLAVAAVVPGVDLAIALVRNRRNVMHALRNACLVVLGALVGFAPQLIGWKLLYGTWLTVPQGTGFLDWRSPHLLEVLVSNRHGLLTWTPVAALALVGLLLVLRKSTTARYALAVLSLQVYVNGAAIEWWGGDAFGARRFVDVAAVLVLGMALLLASAQRHRMAWVRSGVLALCAILVAANLILLQLYRLDRIPRSQPVTFSQAWRAGVQLLRPQGGAP